MTCRAIMTPHPQTLRAEDTVGEAARRLLAGRFHMLPVVDAEGRYVGSFGVFGLIGLLLPRAATLNALVPDLGFMADDHAALQRRLGELAQEPVGRHMRTDLPVLRPETSIVEALLLFYRKRFTLPVVDEATGRLLGIVSPWDALAAIAKGHP